ncbi:MAG: hypothetical protein LBI99_02715 [Propionibacteriaceae bacterium]|jgi:hypothetical protein|nr:hypothetical protein [Propionibacteriaceae bacterium]
MDRIEELLRAAKPDDEHLSAADDAYLKRILAKTPAMLANKDITQRIERKSVSRKRARQRMRWLVSAAATVLVATIVVTVAGQVPAHAYAATPPMLKTIQANHDVATVLNDLSQLSAVQPDRSTRREIVEHVWGLATKVDAQGQPVRTSVIQPEKYVYTLAAWGVAARASYADEPYDIAGSPVVDPALPKPGTLLERDIYTEEDQPPALPPLPEDAAEFSAYFAENIPSQGEPESTTAINRVVAVMYGRTINPRQEAGLLEYLATIPGLELAGECEDRLSRSVYVLRSATWAEQQELLLLDANTGHIAGYETIYIGTSRTDIPSPAVVSYTAWE